MESRNPKNASTVLLVRPDSNGRFEILLTRRSFEMEFLGRFYVFPGGRVGREDWSEKKQKRCRGLSGAQAQKILGNHLSAELSLAHWVAGIRELFEEVEILLCVTEAGAEPDMKDEELARRIAEKRKALVSGSLDFSSLLESEGLYCDAGRAVYFSHR